MGPSQQMPPPPSFYPQLPQRMAPPSFVHQPAQFASLQNQFLPPAMQFFRQPFPQMQQQLPPWPNRPPPPPAMFVNQEPPPMMPPMRMMMSNFALPPQTAFNGYGQQLPPQMMRMLPPQQPMSIMPPPPPQQQQTYDDYRGFDGTRLRRTIECELQISPRVQVDRRRRACLIGTTRRTFRV